MAPGGPPGGVLGSDAKPMADRSRALPGRAARDPPRPPGAHRNRFLYQGGPQVVPGGLREVILIIFGAMLAPFWHRCWSFWELFLLVFWDLREQQREQQTQRRKQQKQQQNSSSESSRSSSETSRSIFGHLLDPHPHCFVSLSLPACPVAPATTASQILRVGGCPG